MYNRYIPNGASYTRVVEEDAPPTQTVPPDAPPPEPDAEAPPVIPLPYAALCRPAAQTP